jgi:hypothetical protein
MEFKRTDLSLHPSGPKTSADYDGGGLSKDGSVNAHAPEYLARLRSLLRAVEPTTGSPTGTTPAENAQREANALSAMDTVHVMADFAGEDPDVHREMYSIESNLRAGRPSLPDGRTQEQRDAVAHTILEIAHLDDEE